LAQTLDDATATTAATAAGGSGGGVSAWLGIMVGGKKQRVSGGKHVPCVRTYICEFSCTTQKNRKRVSERERERVYMCASTENP
jgi:hypothetical protein